MKIAVLAGYAPSLVNFRGPLIREMVGLGHQVVGLAPGDGGATARNLAAMGAGFQPVALDRRGLNPVRDALALAGLRSAFRRLGPDLVLGYTIKPVIYGTWAARMAGVGGETRVFAMITGLGYAFEAGGLLSRLAKSMYRSALSRATGVFFQNPDDRDLFARLDILPRSIPATVTAGSGVDLDHYRPAPLADGPPVFLCISRLLKGKGVVEFVEAARLVKARHPRAVFRLVGPADPGPDGVDPDFITAACDQGVIEYPGEADDVRPHLAACSVYVLPSFREGTPRSVLEAMAVGRAVVTTDVPGCRQTVEQGVSGLLVPVRDVAALAGAMERFLVHPSLIRSMGAASLGLARERFDVRKVNAVILKAMGLR